MNEKTSLFRMPKKKAKKKKKGHVLWNYFKIKRDETEPPLFSQKLSNKYSS